MYSSAIKFLSSVKHRCFEELLVAIDLYWIFSPYYGCQWLLFLIVSSFVFNRRNKFIQVWNSFRVSKLWHHFFMSGWTIPLTFILNSNVLFFFFFLMRNVCNIDNNNQWQSRFRAWYIEIHLCALLLAVCMWLLSAWHGEVVNWSHGGRIWKSKATLAVCYHQFSVSTSCRYQTSFFSLWSAILISVSEETKTATTEMSVFFSFVKISVEMRANQIQQLSRRLP